jgi:ribosomal protein S6
VEEKMAPFYVALCHIRPRTGLTEPVMEKLASLIKTGGGVVRRVNNSGIRPLPTEMRGKGVAEFHKFASIASVEFVSNPPLAISATQQVRGFDDVIRISLLRADELLLSKPPRPSPRRSSTEGSGDHSATQYTSRYDRAPMSKSKPRPKLFDKPRISFLNDRQTDQGQKARATSAAPKSDNASQAQAPTDDKITKE